MTVSRLLWAAEAAVALMLSAQAWFGRIGNDHWLWADLECLLLTVPGLAIACMFWAGRIGLRLCGAALLLAIWDFSPLNTVALFVLPTLAALRRASSDVLLEARVGGAGVWQILAYLVVPLAVPGLLTGALLCLVSPVIPFDVRLLIASFALVLNSGRGSRHF